MIDAMRPSNVGRIREINHSHWLVLGILAVFFAEFRRAAAATQCYEDLIYRSVYAARIALSEIPQLILAKFYST